VSKAEAAATFIVISIHHGDGGFTLFYFELGGCAG